MCTAYKVYNYIYISLPISLTIATDLYIIFMYRWHFKLDFLFAFTSPFSHSFPSSLQRMRHRETSEWAILLISILSVSDIQLCSSSAPFCLSK